MSMIFGNNATGKIEDGQSSPTPRKGRSGKKHNRNLEVDPSLPQDGAQHVDEANYPRSIEKERYLRAEESLLFETVFDKSYQKCGLPLDNSSSLEANSNLQLASFQKSSENPSKSTKKCAQPFFTTGYDSSFQDRISVQTMDSKQFSSSLEFQEREFQIKSAQGKKKGSKRAGNNGANDKNSKDYFDHYIIEDDEENDEEKKAHSQHQDYEQQSQRSEFPKIELESANSQTHYDQSTTTLFPPHQQPTPSLSPTQLKQLQRKKLEQKQEILAAYNQTMNENHVLQQREKELLKQIDRVLLQKQRYEIIMQKERGRDGNPDNDSERRRERLDRGSVRVMRKYSF